MEQVCDVCEPYPCVIFINLNVSPPMLRSARDKQAVPQAGDKGQHCLLASMKWHEQVQCAQGMFAGLSFRAEGCAAGLCRACLLVPLQS